MRTKWIASVLGGAAFALTASAGCGDNNAGQTDLAKLPSPSQEVIDRAKALPQPKPKLKYGAPPRTEIQKALKGSP